MQLIPKASFSGLQHSLCNLQNQKCGEGLVTVHATSEKCQLVITSYRDATETRQTLGERVGPTYTKHLDLTASFNAALIHFIRFFSFSTNNYVVFSGISAHSNQCNFLYCVSLLE